MKFGKKVNYFQAGGAVGGQDPMAVLVEGAQQAIQSQDCQIAMQVCQMILELVGGAQQAPAPAPEQAPAAPQGEPVYRRGGRLIRRINA